MFEEAAEVEEEEVVEVERVLRVGPYSKVQL